MIRILGVRCWWHRPCLEWLCFQGSAQRLVPASCPSEHKWGHLRCPGRKPKAPLSAPCATVNTFNGIFIVIISHNISYIDSPWFTIVVIWKSFPTSYVHGHMWHCAAEAPCANHRIRLSDALLVLRTCPQILPWRVGAYEQVSESRKSSKVICDVLRLWSRQRLKDLKAQISPRLNT